MRSKQEKVEKKRASKKKKNDLSTIILVIIFLIGLSVLLYPTVSDYWNSFHQSRAIATYNKAVSNLKEEDYQDIFDAGHAYNEHLRQLEDPYQEYEQLEEEYYSAMDVAGSGLIGYINIPRIDVQLPIYHGTSETVLNVAVGHFEGSTLPIGGESCHAVLSAHRGLPTAKLFTHLDKLAEGDTFTITVLNQLMTYQVDQILIVEPTQMEALNIAEGKDYVTLITCTPYGINTHRLLVRARRIDNDPELIIITPDAVKIPPYVVVPAVAIPLLFIALLMMVLQSLFRRKPVNIEDYRETRARVFEQVRNAEPQDEADITDHKQP